MRDMIGSIIDYDPNITSYINELNRMINETYLEFMQLRTWPWADTELDVYTVPDLTVTGLSTTSSTAGNKIIAITGATRRMRGCIVQISGCADERDNGEFIIDDVFGSDCALSKVEKTTTTPFLWPGWHSSNASTVTAKIMQRYLPLPQDCNYPISINIRNPVEFGTTGYRSLYQLTRRRDDELNLKLDLEGTPTDWVAYDELPERVQGVSDIPLDPGDLSITEFGVGSNNWPQGTYEFKYCYNYRGVNGPMSDAVEFTVTLSNGNLRFGTPDTTLMGFNGVSKRLFVRIKDVTVAGRQYKEDIFRDCASKYTGLTNTSSTGEKFLEIADDDVSFDWPNSNISPTIENLRSLKRYQDNEGRCWQIRLYPHPSGDRTNEGDKGLPIRVRYNQQAPELINNYDTPKMPSDTHRYIVYRTCEDMFNKFNNPTQAVYYQKKADKELQRIEAKHLTTPAGPWIKSSFRAGPVQRNRVRVNLTHLP